MNTTAVFWFRKGLRLKDNVALVKTLEQAKKSKIKYCCPIFILDPYFASSASSVGANRWRFLAESLDDLDQSLKSINSRLIIIKGKPNEILSQLYDKWNVKIVGFEFDSEPYALERDESIKNQCKKLNIKTICESGHTLYDINILKGKIGKNDYVKSYQSLIKIVNELGDPEKPLGAPNEILSLPNDEDFLKDFTIIDNPLSLLDDKEKPPLPSLYPNSPSHPKLFSSKSEKNPSEIRNSFSSDHCYFIGGETEAYFRLQQYMADKDQVLYFKKPNTSPNALIPSTTTLSPYLKFGCISPRVVWHFIQDLKNKDKKNQSKHSKPPESLHGQLYWREYFYLNSYIVPNFHKMKGNPICKEIDYIYPEKNSKSEENLIAWRDGKTGYPWIDACMIQLQKHGWIHHLGRHAVACFLTRGDLYIHWEEGRDVFDKLLLDSDYALNNANWMWLSASGFFHQYFRVYSPVSFGKKTDVNGDFIRHFIPVLKDMPRKYIYEPWKAPMDIQKKANCIIGEDYPLPIVDHDEVRPINMEKMKAAYARNDNSSSLTKKRKLETKKEPEAKRQKKEK